MALEQSRLSVLEKRRRALFNIIRDNMDYMILNYVLIDSYKNFKAAGKEYPFVDKNHLKPGVVGMDLPEDDVNLHNTSLVIFSEGDLPASHKEHIMFLRRNKLTKENLLDQKLTDEQFLSNFEVAHSNVMSGFFEKTMAILSKVDYGLLIRPDPRIKSQSRYCLTNYSVKIDHSIVKSTETLACDLGYIVNSIYEKDEIDPKFENFDEDLQAMLFKCYGFYPNVKGRRTAAITASQFLRKNSDSDFVVYVTSSQARILTRITADDISKFVLLRMDTDHLKMAEKHNPNFSERFLYDDGLCVFRVIYGNNAHSTPPALGSQLPREFNPKVNWLNVVSQSIMPKKGFMDERPLNYSILYDRKDPFNHEEF